MIIHLNGMPGVGKLTIAKILADILPARLVDNHLIIDLVVNTCGRGPAYIQALNNITRSVYDTLAENSKNENLIFTNALAKGLPEDEERLMAVQQLAERMNKLFVPILIECSEEQNLSRLVSPDRKTKGKLMDQENLRMLIANHQIAHPHTHPNAFTLNTTNVLPEDAAQKIMDHARHCHVADKNYVAKMHP